MLLNITTTHYPATDLGYLLHKHPDKFQTFELTFGLAHVFYPEKSEEKTTVSLLLDIDPIDLVRGKKGSNGEGFSLAQYVNDKPYASTSFMAVAIAKVFSSAMNGRCNDRPELLGVKMPLEVLITSVPAPKGGAMLIQKLFEPLGYQVTLTRATLDEQFPEWGEAKYFNIELSNTLTVSELLSHLYILIPTISNDKHYFVNEFEIDKLLDKGAGWLNDHPEKEAITKRYLANQNSYARVALERLRGMEELESGENDDAATEQTVIQRRKETLHDKRIKMVADKLLESGASTVLDLGCGEGKLLGQLLKNKQFSHIAGMDVSYSELLKAKERLHFDEMSSAQRDRVTLFQSSLTYRDKRFEGFDAAAVVEVIEHIEPNRLHAFERVLFEFAKPKTIILTTPNQEFNVTWETLSAETMRHDDHRFEWTRQEFADWVARVSAKHGYVYQILPIGEELENIGSPSQMAIFTYAN